MFNSLAIQIVLAYILDLILGDPRWFPHPVRGIGWLIKKHETVLRKTVSNERVGGIILAVSVIALSWFLSFIIIRIAFYVSWYLGSFVSIFLIYSSLSARDLDVESMEVYHPLEKKDIILARGKLSLIVGRDTHNLEYRELIRAVVETVSENIVDGIISPLFYAFIGGAPLSMAYKAVNTLDSMVGYKNEKYKDFGWASARIDDCVNFIPARLSIVFLSLAAFLTGKDGLNSWRIARRDGRKNPSPNSGISEAAVAGALEIRLGGLNFYNSVPSIKPYIGNDTNPIEIKHIKESIRISYVCSTLFLISGVFLIAIIKTYYCRY